MGFDWKSTLGAIAPILGTAIGGPFGALAGQALGAALGVDGHDEAALSAALKNATPEQLLAIKQADNQFKLDMAKLGFRPEELAVEDRKSAREREIELKDPTVGRLAWTIIGGFFIVSAAQLVALMGWPELVAKIPGQGWLLIGNISGYLASEAKQAAAYYFGSSVGSKDKDNALATIAKMP